MRERSAEDARASLSLPCNRKLPLLGCQEPRSREHIFIVAYLKAIFFILGILQQLVLLLQQLVKLLLIRASLRFQLLQQAP